MTSLRELNLVIALTTPARLCIIKYMNPEYLPPMPQQPYSPPNGAVNGDARFGQMPNQSQAPSGVEQEGPWQKSIRRSKQTRAATKQVIHTRKDLEQYLANQGIKLLTSATEFQESGNFLTSSYVVFTGFENYRERLVDFLVRYPQLRPIVEAISVSIQPISRDLHIKNLPHQRI